MTIKISGSVKPAYKISPSRKSESPRGWKKAETIIHELLKHKESVALLATVRKCSRECLRLDKLAVEMNAEKLQAELELCQKFGISVSDLFYVELAVEMKETEELLKKVGGGAHA
jgi:hypothetical protein